MEPYENLFYISISLSILSIIATIWAGIATSYALKYRNRWHEVITELREHKFRELVGDVERVYMRDPVNINEIVMFWTKTLTFLGHQGRVVWRDSEGGLVFDTGDPVYDEVLDSLHFKFLNFAEVEASELFRGQLIAKHFTEIFSGEG